MRGRQWSTPRARLMPSTRRQRANLKPEETTDVRAENESPCRGFKRRTLSGDGRRTARRTRHRDGCRRRLGNLGTGKGLRDAGQLRALPLRQVEEKALLRWHAFESWLRRHGDREPRTVLEAGSSPGWPRGTCAHGCRASLRLRPFLRSEWPGLEPDRKHRQPG